MGLDIKRTGWQQCRMPLGICSVSCCLNTGQRVREAVGDIDWFMFQVQNNLWRNTQLSDVDHTPYNSSVFAGPCLLVGQCIHEASVFVSVWNMKYSQVPHLSCILLFAPRSSLGRTCGPLHFSHDCFLIIAGPHGWPCC